MHASSMIARASIPYFDLIEQLCHHKLLGPEVFVHEVGFSNLPFCIGALESSSGTKILHWPWQFLCTCSETFNLGTLTATFENITTGKSPLFVSPALVYMEQTTEAYSQLFQSMLVMYHSLKNVKAVDSDEESLINATELAFFDSIHLWCFIHIRDLRKLTGLCFLPQLNKKWFVTYSDGNCTACTTKVCLYVVDD